MWKPKSLGHIQVMPPPPPNPLERAPVLNSLPIIIRGSKATLGKLSDWTPEYISERLADRELPISTSDPDGVFRYNPDGERPLHFEQMRGKELAAGLRKTTTDRKLCLQQTSIIGQLPELSSELVIPPYISTAKLNEVNLWMASEGSNTPLHYDDMHNLFAQVEGRKKFLLFNPDQLSRLYPGPLNTRLQHLSSVNLRAPNFRRFPELEHVEYWEAVVMPGDLLFMPAFWWHQVYSLDVTVSVNYWWRADVSECISPGFFRQLQMNMVLEDVRTLFRTYEFDSLGAGQARSDAVLALAELALSHGEVNVAARLCGGVVVAALQDVCRANSISPDGLRVPDILAKIEKLPTQLSGELDLVHYALTVAMASRSHRATSFSEVAGLISRLRRSTVKWECVPMEIRRREISGRDGL
jgi:hypothetical protein